MKSSLNITKLFMQLSGIWPVKFVSLPARWFYAPYTFYVQGMFIYFATSLMLEFIRLAMQSSRSDRMSSGATVMLSAIIINIRSLIYRKNNIPEMYEEVLQMEQAMKVATDDDLLKSYKKFGKFNLLVNISVVLNTVILSMALVVNGFTNVLKVGVENYNFEQGPVLYELYFPISRNDHKTLIIIINVYMCILGLIFNIGSQTTLYSLMNMASFRLNMLGVKIKKFPLLARRNNNDEYLTIKQCIIEHQNLIRFVQLMNESVKYVVLMEFLFNTFTVASVLFQLVTIKVLSKFLFAFLFNCMLVSQIFIFAWTANEVKEQSVSISNCIYESPWYETNKEVKTLLLIMLLRTQKPLVVTIGPFNPMTNETALMTLKAAYSYATVMMKGFQEE